MVDKTVELEVMVVLVVAAVTPQVQAQEHRDKEIMVVLLPVIVK
jgi:hypothetical protein